MESSSKLSLSAVVSLAATTVAVSFGLGYYLSNKKNCDRHVSVGNRGADIILVRRSVQGDTHVYSPDTLSAAGLSPGTILNLPPRSPSSSLVSAPLPSPPLSSSSTSIDPEDPKSWPAFDDGHTKFALPPLSLPPALAQGVLSLVGNTPLIRISSLSEQTGCEIWGKAEFLNPGGSVKDRIALEMICDAFSKGRLKEGGLVTEGTAGSTGVSLALVAAAFGCRTAIYMPDDAAVEKSEMLRALGADVRRVRPVSIVHPENMVNLARKRAQEENDGRSMGGEENKHDNNNNNNNNASSNNSHIKNDGMVNRDPSSSQSSDFGSLFADQFENPVNLRAHLRTGEEIFRQANSIRIETKTPTEPGDEKRQEMGSIPILSTQLPFDSSTSLHSRPSMPALHAFVSAAGTGGTLAGVSRALKSRDSRIQTFLVDPPGSGLYNKVTRGVMYTREEAEGKRLRNPFDTITEGVGINRITKNFAGALVDDAVRCSDREAVEMANYLIRNDALFVGSSAAVNCVGAVKVARRLGPGHVVVTVLCDGGHRHLSKFHNKEYLARYGLEPKAEGKELSFISLE